MSANPNPSKITDAMWRLWEESAKVIPGVRLGGIYADKKCYHNTVSANKSQWPGGYCIELPLDLTGPFDKARAIDLTMSDAEMIKRTTYLKTSALDPRDDRLRGVREFIGTLDCDDVDCWIHDDDYGPWRYDGSRDDSHLWHIHISIFTAFCATWDGYLDGVLSVLSGQSYDEYASGGDSMFCNYGETSAKVEAMQRLILLVDPNALPEYGPDKGYGDETAAALVALGVCGGDTTGHSYGPSEYANLQALVAQVQGGGGGEGIGVGSTVTIVGTVTETQPA